MLNSVTSHGRKCARTQRKMLTAVAVEVLLEPEGEGSLGFFLIELKVKKQTLNFYSLDVSSGVLANTAATNNL